MGRRSKEASTLQASTYDDLMALEPEILNRINRLPNGGQLFHLDPARLLADVGVHLSADAASEWRRRAGDGWPDTAGVGPVYEAVGQAPPDGRIEVTVRSLGGRTGR